MSTLKTNNAQIGQSATATNNFTWYQPASPDGTVRLGVGNSGATTADALKVDNSGNLIVSGNITSTGSVPTERIVVGTATSLSGSATGFTGIPSWAKKITLTYSGAAASGGSFGVQIGSGSYSASGYVCYSTVLSSSTATTSLKTSGFDANPGSALASACGTYILTLQNSTNNTWVASYSAISGQLFVGSGYISLAGALDRVQVYSNGTFSAGSVNIIYEG